MRIHLIALSLFATLATLMAQAPSPAADLDRMAVAAREAALDNLLSERESFEAFNSMIAEARKAGVCEQAILEARFLYHVDCREDEAIAAMLPEFLRQRSTFQLEDSAIFGVTDDWLAVVEYVQATASLEKGDRAGFKQHITEAFWLSPRQAAAFAPSIERLRLEEAMRSVKVDFASGYAALDSENTVVLADLMKGKKAMLFHFWSPRSRECEASLPDFSKTAASLQANGIAVVSMLPQGSIKTLTDAQAMIAPYSGKPCGAWLIDGSEKSIGRDLRIQNLPTMVLIASEGGILFNGDPTDQQFWEALKKIDPAIVRPESAIESGK